MRHRPGGTITFLFTDMEGSIGAWEAHSAETQAALKRHDEIMAREIETRDGVIVLERGEGDSVFAILRERAMPRAGSFDGTSKTKGAAAART